ncbi:MAG: GNAT family N-acetyltransferase [Candidatus Daviesbacteria bacterium]|nr:GNAT family N-acetyltransferase [Candidatus Daviesbacteria bacterium]
MEIREAQEKDIPQIMQIKNWGTEKDWNKEVLERINKTKERKTAYLVAEENGKILGQIFLKFYGIKTAPNYPSMEDAYVKEEFRGQGIGTKLIEESEKISRKNGFNKIGLAVNPTLNPKAKSLYERLGYKEVGDPTYLDGVYNGTEDWVIDMVKEL